MIDNVLMDLINRVNGLEKKVEALTPAGWIDGVKIEPETMKAIAGLYEAAENGYPPFPRYIERVGTWLSSIRKANAW